MIFRRGQMHRHVTTHTHLTCLIKTHPAPETQTCECFPWGVRKAHSEKNRRLNFFFFVLLAYNYRDCWNAWPRNKAESWESPLGASPSSVCGASLVGCHPHCVRVRSLRCLQHQKSPLWRLHTLLQWAKLLRLRGKKSKAYEWLKTLASEYWCIYLP